MTLRPALAVLAAALLGLAGPTAAAGSTLSSSSAPAVSSVPSSSPAGGGELCTVDDSRLKESSGLAVLPDGSLVSHNDSGDEARYLVIDRTCDVVAQHRLRGISAFDWEDAAAGPGPDGEPSLWFADTGDNKGQRTQPAVVVVAEPDPTETGTITDRGAVKYQLTYPVPGIDVETLLVDPLGRGFALVSKSAFGQASVLVPSGALDAEGVTAMLDVAQVSLAPTGTPGGPASGLGALAAQVAVTGGDISPAGDRLVLRTYTDAYAWVLDPTATSLRAALVAALATDPVTVPLAPTGQGEAIAFDTDGGSWLTTTEGRPTPIGRVMVPPAPTPSASPTPTPEAGASAGDLPASGLPDTPTLVLAVLGVLLGAFVVTSVLARTVGGRVRR